MPTLTVTFTNNNTDIDSSLISIGFSSKSAFTITNIANGNAILPLDNGVGPYPFAGNWYKLADLSSGVSITSFSGGRIYACYGPAWVLLNGGYEPSQAGPTDLNFLLRYDKMEMTFTGAPADVADMTSIDYWSIPMTLTTMGPSGNTLATLTGLKNSATSLQIYNALIALTASLPSGLANALQALVPGKFVPGGTFARVIGPSPYPPVFSPGSSGQLTKAFPVQPYDLLQAYLHFLTTTFGPGTAVNGVIAGLGGGTIASITGRFGGVKDPTGPTQMPQDYALTATIDANNDITLTGTLTLDGQAPQAVTIVYAFQDLVNPTGIYGGNPNYTRNGAYINLPPNDVYSWISGDLTAGLMIGAIGSQTNIGGTVAGTMNSSAWFNLGVANLFQVLQPANPNFYNQWAATLTPLSDAYNFAYTDRMTPSPQISLNAANVATLNIALEDTSAIAGNVPNSSLVNISLPNAAPSATQITITVANNQTTAVTEVQLTSAWVNGQFANLGANKNIGTLAPGASVSVTATVSNALPTAGTVQVFVAGVVSGGVISFAGSVTISATT